MLGQPGQNWTSQRDHLLLAMLYNTGARVSEIIGVRVVDVVLDGAPACICTARAASSDRSRCGTRRYVRSGLACG